MRLIRRGSFGAMGLRAFLFADFFIFDTSLFRMASNNAFRATTGAAAAATGLGFLVPFSFFFLGVDFGSSTIASKVAGCGSSPPGAVTRFQTAKMRNKTKKSNKTGMSISGFIIIAASGFSCAREEGRHGVISKVLHEEIIMAGHFTQVLQIPGHCFG